MSRDPDDYAERMADAKSEGADSFTAKRYAGGAMPRRFLGELVEEPDEDDEPEDDE